MNCKLKVFPELPTPVGHYNGKDNWRVTIGYRSDALVVRFRQEGAGTADQELPVKCEHDGCQFDNGDIVWKTNVKSEDFKGTLSYTYINSPRKLDQKNVN